MCSGTTEINTVAVTHQSSERILAEQKGRTSDLSLLVKETFEIVTPWNFRLLRVLMIDANKVLHWYTSRSVIVVNLSLIETVIF